MTSIRPFHLLLALALGACVLPLPAAARGPAAAAALPAHGVVAVEERQLEPGYWIGRLGDAAGRLYLDDAAIARQNAALVERDDSMRDIAALPRALPGSEVRGWITALSSPPEGERYGADGAALPAAFFDALEANLALDGVPRSQPTRYGLVVRRAALRTFPDDTRVFSRPGDTDIDRFQESALFPGDAVVVAHASRDGAWLFVVSARYSAWIERDAVAVGTRDTVLGYRDRSPALVVTAATVRTVFNPERPEVSELQLDMGVRVPLLADWPPDRAVHGQHPLFGHVIELPVRTADGSLALVPALLPRTAEVAAEPLPLTPANIIAQGFKFLGERYGWGHSYNARDCSGFVSEVYRSMGVQVPRNTSDQSVSPALDRTAFDGSESHEERLAEVAKLQVGDLVYIPGHVMMVIGREHGTTYTIHDTTGIGYLGAGGELVRMPLNGVVVTPLEPLMAGADTPTIDRITSIVRIR
ncbi:SH3 domain-containing protein [Luteimonas sp. RD2P54]|uniref:SH3 domain-containing protein n=1 Tax=Luteimonas endophytica TaxID=3042023 RepID=A0ABT6JC00_9GAMM|nr:SH3 domain-containing protein [Luteimonas endophytica]MDH5824339.1 SH3 domain-containing protein [Luteimonas endophytica]